MRGLRIVTAVAVLSVACGVAVAQSAPMVGADGKPLAFSVVSIRENLTPMTAAGPPVYGPTANGYHATNLSLGLLLLAAYIPTHGADSAFFEPNQIVGLTDAFRARYDIDARVSDADMPAWQDATKRPAMMRAMLQQMLMDRFKMKVHYEMKDQPIFELLVGKNGPKLKEAASTDLAAIQQAHPTAKMLPGGAMVSQGAQGAIELFGASMQTFGTLVGEQVGRPVEDKTGLTGKYDITFQIDMAPGPNGQEPDEESAIITAVQQLGLRLEAAKGSVETLVIDHIERPTEN